MLSFKYFGGHLSCIIQWNSVFRYLLYRVHTEISLAYFRHNSRKRDLGRPVRVPPQVVGSGDAWLAHRNPLRGYLVYSTELLIIFVYLKTMWME